MPALQSVLRAGGAVTKMVAGAGLSAGLGFLAQIAIGRYFGPSFYGQFVICLTVATVFAPLVTGGLPMFESDPRVVSNKQYYAAPISCWFRAGLVLGIIATLMLTVWITGDWLIAFVGCTYLVASSAVERALGKLQIAQSFQAVAVLQPVVYVARLGAVIVGALIASELTVWWLMALLHLMIVAALFHRFEFFEGKTTSSCSLATFKLAAKELLPLVGISLVIAGTSQADRLVLALFADPVTVGVFGVAASFIVLADLIPGVPALRFLLPMLTRSVDFWPRRSQIRLIFVLVLGSAGLGILMAAALSAVASPIILTFFGPGFVDSIGILSLLAWSLPARFVRIATGPYFVRGKLKHVGVISNAVLLLLLVAGMTGAFSIHALNGLIWAKILIETLSAVVMVCLLFIYIDQAHAPKSDTKTTSTD